MKRTRNLFDRIIDYDNLCKAAHKAFLGKKGNAEVIKFQDDFCSNINNLRKELIDGSVEIGGYRQFIIYEPKQRCISAVPLRQRIVHHAIMNVCHEYFERKYVDSSFASRPKKGIHQCIKYAYDNAGRFKYFCKLDVRKYFDSIDHNVLKNMLARMFKDKRLLSLFYRIIDSYNIGGTRGIPIGNLTSQYFANIYLTRADMFAYQEAHVRFYARYMDDILIMGNDKQNLIDSSRRLIRFVDSDLHLSFKPPIIGTLKVGVNYLGYRINFKGIYLSGKSKRRYRTRLSEIVRKYNNEKISEKDAFSRMQSVISCCKIAKSLKFRKACLESLIVN